jgi:GT2 family glycosyltransferase
MPEVGMVWTNMEAVDTQRRHLHPRYLRVMYGAYSRFPRTEDLFTSQQTIRNGAKEVQVHFGDIFSQMVLGNLVHTSTVLLRRDRAKKAGGFREKFRRAGEDFDFHLRVCREGPVAFIDEVTIQYQVGAPDAITRPELRYDFAVGYIATLQDTLARDRDRITIPNQELVGALAGAFAWAGRAALDSGRTREARRMCRNSLRLRPFQGEASKVFLMACLPGRLRARVGTWAKTVRALRSRAGLATGQTLLMFGPVLGPVLSLE